MKCYALKIFDITHESDISASDKLDLISTDKINVIYIYTLKAIKIAQIACLNIFASRENMIYRKTFRDF